MCGHDWLEDLWTGELPEDIDQELGALLMTLSFFASRSLAEAFQAEGVLRTQSVEATAEFLLRLLPDALGEYAHLGRSMLGGLAHAPRRPPQQSHQGWPERGLPIR